MSEAIRLLIVDDSDADAKLVAAELERSGFAPDWQRVHTPADLAEALASRSWDAVVVDHQVPWPAGPTSLDLVRQAARDIPFIVVSGFVGEEAAVELVRAGAHDFVTKDHLSRLPQAIRRETREARARAERRRSEEALRESEERYRRLFEGAGDAIFVVDRRSGRYLDANHAAEVLTGRTLQDLRKLSTTDVVPGGAGLRLQIASGLTETRELGDVEYVRPDGTTRTVLLSIVPINDAVVYGIAHDISERKRAEDALRRGDEQLRSIFSAAPTGIGVVVGRVIQSVNDRMCELNGYPADEQVGRVTRFLYDTDEEFDRVGREVQRQTTEQYNGSLETRWVRKDGSLIDVQLSWAPIDVGDLSRGVTFVTLDITERTRAEEGRRRLAAAIEQSEEGVMITDPEGIIEYVNPAFTRITGYPFEEAVNNHARLLRSGKQDLAFYQQLWGTIKAGRTWTGRFINRRKDGRLYHEDCSISPVFGAAGQIERFVAAKRDVTKSLRLEEELRQSQRVESLGRLAAVVAHDFNNLLSPILGYSELLLAEMQPSDERFGQIQEIERASRRARDLTRQLLAFGRKQALQIRPVDLNGVAEGFERLLRRGLREDVALAITKHPFPCVVMADQGQAEQVVMNLAVNAQDAMPDGGQLEVRIETRTMTADDCASRPGSTPGDYGVLVVSDTGYGMDAETLARIFEPFFSTKGERGTGLGLSTVYGIVKQHGGHVFVESEPGRGTTFEVYLPATSAVPAAEKPPSRAASRQRGSETILLVEDNEAVRTLAETVLQREGYVVFPVSGGDEAMALLGQYSGEIDLLLTDVVLSGMDGHTLYQRLSARYPRLRVLFMSGYADDVVAHRGVLEGEFAFVSKPFSIVSLTWKVREALGT